MRNGVPVVLTSILAGGSAFAAPAKVQVEHKPLACAVAGRNLQIDAKITPDQEVASAKVKFRTDQRWYAVPLHVLAGRWVAVLPQPKGSLDRFEYQIEVIGLETDLVETALTTVRIVKEASECRGGLVGTTAEPTEALLVDMPPGSTKSTRLVPDGFSPEGVAGDIGVFDFGTKTALVGATLAGGGALYFLRDKSTAPLAPPEHAVITLLGTEPAPGSTLSVASSVVTFRLHIDAHNDDLQPGTLAVDFNACAELRVPFAGLAANSSADLEVTGRLQPYACAVPSVAGRLLYSAFDGNGRAQAFAQTTVTPLFNMTP